MKQLIGWSLLAVFIIGLGISLKGDWIAGIPIALLALVVLEAVSRMEE